MPPSPQVSGPPAEVRIIGGQWKRSKLAVVDLPGLRPTPDRVRVTLFNWLGQDLSGWRCLDAFAGSGALGFEAASRGAAEVLLLERNAGQVKRLREAAERLHATTLRIEQIDALSFMARAESARFELVFLDPPFDSGLDDAALQAAIRLVVPDGFIYLESDRAIDAAGVQALGLRLHRQGHAGRVCFQLLHKLSPGSAGAAADPSFRSSEAEHSGIG